MWPAGINVPDLADGLVTREHLLVRLRDATQRLALVHAPSGYGKTTLLAQVARDQRAAWLDVAAVRDPGAFAALLRAALQRALILPVRTAPDERDWRSEIDWLLHDVHAAAAGDAPALVLDNAQLLGEWAAGDALLERLVRGAPPGMRLLIAAREPLRSRLINRLRIEDAVIELTRADLAFREGDIAQLLRTRTGITDDDRLVAQLAHLSGGWPLAVAGLCRELARQRPDGIVRSLAALVRGSALGDYLEAEWLAGLAPAEQQLLENLALLPEFSADLADAVGELTPGSSRRLLLRLTQLDVGVIHSGADLFRLHPLWAALLRERLQQLPDAGLVQRRAADWWLRQGRPEQAFDALAQHGGSDEAVDLLVRGGRALIARGRHRLLAERLARLPEHVIREQPSIQCLFGDEERIHARFAAAERWYRQAERTARRRGDRRALAEALHRQALVLVDQVQPRQAEGVLAEALRVAEGLDDQQAQADLLELLAENRLNLGEPLRAEQLRNDAALLREARPDDDLLTVRVWLRSGRLQQARALLERPGDAVPAAAADEPPLVRGHRERSLLLALIAVFLGDTRTAVTEARAALDLGRRADAPFVVSVAYARLGHAELLTALAGDTAAAARAQQAYDLAWQTAQSLAVERLRVEPLWGRIRLAGLQGDLSLVHSSAVEARRICQWAGDLWLAAVVELSTAQALAAAGAAVEAQQTYERAAAEFRQGNDPHGEAGALLGLALLGRLNAGDTDRLLTLCAGHELRELLTQPTLLGAADAAALTQLVTRIARADRHRLLLERLGLAIEPGVLPAATVPQLDVQLIGTFHVVCNGRELQRRDWQRAKARQVFQVLALRRGRWLARDQLIDLLWPDSPADIGQRDLKIALSAVYRALEPQLQGGRSSLIERLDGQYRLRPGDDITIDVERLRHQCSEGLALLDRQQLDAAAACFAAAAGRLSDELLPELRYEAWLDEERRQLQEVLLNVGDRLLPALYAAGRDDLVLATAEAMLHHDPLCEPAYRAAMLAHARQGRRSSALRLYERCGEAFMRELDSVPAEATTRLATLLRSGRQVPLPDDLSSS